MKKRGNGGHVVGGIYARWGVSRECTCPVNSRGTFISMHHVNYSHLVNAQSALQNATFYKS